MDGFAELANKTFHLYRCSPLFSFHNDVRKSRNKVRTLAVFLSTELQLSIAEKTTHENARGEIKDIRFENLPIPEISSYKSEIKPLKITIQIRFTKDKADTAHVFILIPAMAGSADNSDYSYYPLMLAKAKSIVTDEVMAWFKRYYSCHISTLYIPAPTFHSVIKTWIATLSQLAPLEDELVKAPLRTVEHAFELDYVVPNQKELSDISIKFKLSEIMKLHKKLKNKEDFLFALQSHLFNTTNINVGALTVGKIATPNMGLDKEGRLKMFGQISRTEASKVISDLVELASTK